MPVNPYDSPATSSDVPIAASNGGSVATSSFSPVAKVGLCVLGIAMFATNPWRDLWFYEDVARHEGFDTTADSYIIGFAGQLLATLFFFPVALFLIIFGIARSTRFSIRPRFDRFTWGWGLVASITAILMVLIESDYVIYGLQHVHHLDTALISIAYMAFIYIWWCCSLAHGPGRNRVAARVSPPGLHTT
jgi:hypothetical protein